MPFVQAPPPLKDILPPFDRDWETNTATIGETRGGGNGCSVGPVSLES